MPPTTLTVDDLSPYGVGLAAISVTTVDDVNGNEFVNDGRSLLVVVNDDGSTPSVLTVTGVAGPRSYNETPTYNQTVTAGDRGVFGPFDPAVWNDSSGMVQLAFTSATNVAAAIVRLPFTPRP